MMFSVNKIEIFRSGSDMVPVCGYATLHHLTGSRFFDLSVQENYTHRFIRFDFVLHWVHAASVHKQRYINGVCKKIIIIDRKP